VRDSFTHPHVLTPRNGLLHLFLPLLRASPAHLVASDSSSKSLRRCVRASFFFPPRCFNRLNEFFSGSGPRSLAATRERRFPSVMGLHPRVGLISTPRICVLHKAGSASLIVSDWQEDYGALPPIVGRSQEKIFSAFSSFLPISPSFLSP